MISVRSLTKRFGQVTAVDDLSFEVREGAVTGFLGPNGSGKTTTLRMILGLARPTAGTATIDGRPYADLANPTHTVGAVLERSGFHPGRSGRDHLRVLCAAARLPVRRADEVLELVGLTDAAGRRVGGYSLGMRQRLSLAGGLLGDPEVLILDEPANGLDPQGIRDLRDLLRKRASAGGTVLVSSHVLAEVSQAVDDVVVIHRGKLIRQAPVGELTRLAAGGVEARSPEAPRLRDALTAAGIDVELVGPEELRARGTTAAAVGDVAAEHGVPLHWLSEESASLEDVFLALTGTAA